SVLHPGLKLEYFQKQSWDAEWIDEVISVTRAEYLSRYKGKTSCPKKMSAATAPESTEKQKSNAFWGFGNYSPSLG
ncbi:hypothetical protein BDN67DRAFT_888454, partial [Paxillus ammoniavirescens]